MKKLTLAKTWQECLRMWKWIAENYKNGDEIDDLKIEWLKKHDIAEDEISVDCFFCEYCDGKCENRYGPRCPGVQVNRRFTCHSLTYGFRRKPVKFYQKLVELNKKRLEKK